MKNRGTNIFIFFTAIILMISVKSFAQDIQFSQFYAVAMYQNPAFAGASHYDRAMFHQRLQWPGNQARYTTSYISYDKFFSKYQSGFGISLMHDVQGASIINTSDLGLHYSYELHLSPKYTVRAGLQFSVVSRSIDYSKLTFPSQYNDQGFNGGAAASVVPEERKNYGDISTGYLLYSNNLWVGLAAHHLNTPNQTFLRDQAKLPMKFSLTGGYKFILSSDQSGLISGSSDLTEISITPTFHYKTQGKADQIDLGLYSNYKQLILGMWYRGIPFKKYSPDFHNSESMVFIVGFKEYAYSVSYSYDLTVSTLVNTRTGGAHELNLVYMFGKFKRNLKPSKRMPCPKFYVH